MTTKAKTKQPETVTVSKSFAKSKSSGRALVSAMFGAFAAWAATRYGIDIDTIVVALVALASVVGVPLGVIAIDPTDNRIGGE